MPLLCGKESEKINEMKESVTLPRIIWFFECLCWEKMHKEGEGVENNLMFQVQVTGDETTKKLKT